MYSEFPQLQKKLDELRWKFEKALQETIEQYGLEDVELRINATNFIPRSPVTKSAYYLREILDECLDDSGKITQVDKIDEEHIAAAQGLLKLGKYQGAAIEILTQILVVKLDKKTQTNLKLTDSSPLRKEAEEKQKQLKNLRKLASDALSECGSEISSFDASERAENSSSQVNFFEGMKIKVNGGKTLYCDVDDTTQTAYCPGGKIYSRGQWTPA